MEKFSGNTRVGDQYHHIVQYDSRNLRQGVRQRQAGQSFDMEVKPGYCYLRDAKMTSQNTQTGTNLVHFERVVPSPKTNTNTGSNSRVFCGNYAKTAQAQQQENIRLNCGFQGGSWQINYNRHFNWCMGASTANANGETNRRTTRLNQCRSNANRGNSAFCDSYAKSAQAHQRQNPQLGCGYTGNRWQLNYNNHVSWCMRANSTAVNFETNARILALHRCKQKRSGVIWGIPVKSAQGAMKLEAN